MDRQRHQASTLPGKSERHRKGGNRLHHCSFGSQLVVDLLNFMAEEKYVCVCVCDGQKDGYNSFLPAKFCCKALFIAWCIFFCHASWSIECQAEAIPWPTHHEFSKCPLCRYDLQDHVRDLCRFGHSCKRACAQQPSDKASGDTDFIACTFGVQIRGIIPEASSSTHRHAIYL